jgi:hypothetical protein
MFTDLSGMLTEHFLAMTHLSKPKQSYGFQVSLLDFIFSGLAISLPMAGCW